jgi:ribosomal-protein-serine acetyltransferase
MRLPVDERTVLRSPSEDDAPALFKAVDAGRAYLRRWLPWVDATTTAEFTRGFLRSAIAGAIEGKSLILVIEHDGEPCGTVGFNWIDPLNGGCEIGYWLREDRQGRGIMTACCRVLVRHAFDELGLNQVRIAVAVENARSRRIPERLGFHLDGVIREAEKLSTGHVDQALYTFLRRDRGA